MNGNTYTITLREVYSADDLHERLVELLPLPEYYGGTLDALFDVLTEPRCRWSLSFTECAEAEAALGKYYRSFRRMCEDAASSNENLTVQFAP